MYIHCVLCLSAEALEVSDLKDFPPMCSSLASSTSDAHICPPLGEMRHRSPLSASGWPDPDPRRLSVRAPPDPESTLPVPMLTGIRKLPHAQLQELPVYINVPVAIATPAASAVGACTHHA